MTQPDVPPQQVIAVLQAHLEDANDLIAILRGRAATYRAAVGERDTRIAELETELLQHVTREDQP